MNEAPTSLLSAWSNFYVITGSSAAALTGLMFVVITLVAGGRSQASHEGISMFSTPTVVHFGAALLTSALLNVPWRSLAQAGIMLSLVGLYGVGYTLHVMKRTRRQSAYEAQLDDWLWYAAFPLVGYVALVAAAIGLVPVPVQALFASAGSVLLLIFIGIHNAWDVVTYIAVEQVQPPSGSAVPAGADSEPAPTVQLGS